MNSRIKSALSIGRRVLPRALIHKGAILYGAIQHIRNRNRTPNEIFDAIYAGGRWGDDGEALCSGEGSRGVPLDLSIEPIASVILQDNFQSISDIGCGDFHFGEALLAKLPPTVTYFGIDVSSVVIEHLHKSGIENDRIKFAQIDATTTQLPRCDVAIVRQVFQHLSNDNIQKILTNLRSCANLIVVEHFPPPSELRALNSDISTGLITRRFKNSAVDIGAPPFEHSFTLSRTLFNIDLQDIGGELIGRLYTNKISGVS